MNVGDRFGRLTVTGLIPGHGPRGGPITPARANVICDCGTETTVVRTAMTYGKTTSCGCYHRERLVEVGRRARVHGESSYAGHYMETREYSVWASMKYRCLNPKSKAWPSYGGRGITVCLEWVSSFEAFLRDMGRCPDGYSLDRIDNSAGYSPDNCRWTDWKTQANNRRPMKKRSPKATTA